MANNRWHKMLSENALQLALRDIQIRALERAKNSLEKEKIVKTSWYDTRDEDRARAERLEGAIESRRLLREWGE